MAGDKETMMQKGISFGLLVAMALVPFAILTGGAGVVAAGGAFWAANGIAHAAKGDSK